MFFWVRTEGPHSERRLNATLFFFSLQENMGPFVNVWDIKKKGGEYIKCVTESHFMWEMFNRNINLLL